jgi:hypothetical protein
VDGEGPSADVIEPSTGEVFVSWRDSSPGSGRSGGAGGPAGLSRHWRDATQDTRSAAIAGIATGLDARRDDIAEALTHETGRARSATGSTSTWHRPCSASTPNWPVSTAAGSPLQRSRPAVAGAPGALRRGGRPDPLQLSAVATGVQGRPGARGREHGGRQTCPRHPAFPPGAGRGLRRASARRSPQHGARWRRGGRCSRRPSRGRPGRLHRIHRRGAPHRRRLRRDRHRHPPGTGRQGPGPRLRRHRPRSGRRGGGVGVIPQRRSGLHLDRAGLRPPLASRPLRGTGGSSDREATGGRPLRRRHPGGSDAQRAGTSESPGPDQPGHRSRRRES